MADLKKTVEIVFGAVDNTAKGLSSVESKLEGIASKASDLSGKIVGVTTAIGAAGLALTTFAISEQSKWEKGVGAIASLFNGTTDDIKSLSDELIKYAGTSTQTLDNITTATYNAVSAGIARDDVTEFLGIAEELAIAGVTDLNTAVSLLTSVSSAYGLKIDDIKGTTEDLFTAVQLGKTDLVELEAALGNVTGIAAATQTPVSTLLSALAALTVAGIQTPQATTALRALLQELAAPSEELKTALNGLSLQADGLPKVLQALGNATGGAYQPMAELFSSTEALKGALALTGGAAETFSTALGNMETNAGNVDQAFAEAAKNIQNNIQQLQTNLRIGLINAGNEIKEPIQKIVDSGADVASAFAVSIDSPNLQPVFAAINQFGDDLSRDLKDIAKIFPEAFANVDFDNLIRSVESLYGELGEAFANVFGPDLDLTQVDDLTQFLQGVIDLVATFVSTTKGVVDGFQPLFKAIGVANSEISQMEGGIAEKVGNVVGTFALIDQLGAKLGGFLVALDQFDADFGQVFENIKDGAAFVANAMQVVFDFFAKEIATAIADINGGLASITFGSLSDSFERESNKFRDLADGISLSMQDNMTEAGQAWDRLTGSSENAANQIGSDASRINNSISGLADGARGSLSGIPSAVRSETQLAMAQIDASLAASTQASQERMSLAALEAKTTQTNIVSSAATAQAAISANASIAITELQTGAERVRAIMSGITATVTSSGSVLSSLIDQLVKADDKSLSTRSRVEREIDSERYLRDKAAEQARKLAELEIKLLDKKLARLNNDEGLITITADGLEPELEAFMWKIIERVKIRAAEDQAEFLLGWGA